MMGQSYTVGMHCPLLHCTPPNASHGSASSTVVPPPLSARFDRSWQSRSVLRHEPSEHCTRGVGHCLLTPPMPPPAPPEPALVDANVEPRPLLLKPATASHCSLLALQNPFSHCTGLVAGHVAPVA